MKKELFLKNIFVLGIYVLATLAYFKALVYRSDTDVLAEYFYYKAIAIAISYLFSFRYSDIAFVLKANLSSGFETLSGLFVVVYGFIAGVSILLAGMLFILDTEIVVYVFLAITIYMMNDAIEGFVGMCRLFYAYKIIFILRVLLFMKVIIFLVIPPSELGLLNILLYESFFTYTLFLIIAIFNFKSVHRNILEEIRYLLNNMHAVYSPWLQSISKLSYDALPQILLANLVSNTIYVEYNIVRRLLNIFGGAMQPILQIFVVESQKYRYDFKIYLRKYYTLIIPLGLFIIAFVYFNFSFVITTITKSEFVSENTRLLILLSFSLFFLFLILMPIKHFLMLKDELKLLSIGFFTSSIIIAPSVYFILESYGAFGAVLTQGIGIILPLIIAIFIYYSQKK